MNENEIKQIANNWYTLGRNFLPNFDSPAFARLAGKSHGFAYETVGENDRDILLKVDPTAPTAYVDLHKNEIAIPAKYFSRELYVNRYGVSAAVETEALAIAVINGAVIHEALHIKHTAKDGPVTIKDAVERVYKGRKAIKEYGLDNAATAFNIIEDIFIEANTPKNLKVWIQACSDIHFAKDDLDRDWDLTQIDDFMNLAICWKNKENRGHVAFESFSPEQLKLLRRATMEASDYFKVNKRVETAMDFLSTFPIPDPDETEGKDEGEGEGKDGEDEKDSKSETKPDPKGKTEDSKSDESEGESELESTTADTSASKTMREALEETEAPTGKELDEIKKEVKEAADEIVKEESPDDTATIGGIEITWRKPIEKDIHKVNKTMYASSDPETEINFAFLKNLQAIRTANRTPGAARKTGSVMVKSRLTRIATDGKIFSKNDSERNTLKRIEVIINVDFSASTTGRIINNELGAAKAMSLILRAAGIAHSVYGHTSKSPNDTPLLFHIFSYDMKVTNHDFDDRFEAARHVRLSQNYDGVVIERLGEKFTGRNGKRFLINLSDGIPEGPGYTGRAAMGHTKQKIQDLRNKGIGVFAISVVEYVVRENDDIYGKDFNIDGSKNTNSQFQRLIEKIATG